MQSQKPTVRDIKADLERVRDKELDLRLKLAAAGEGMSAESHKTAAKLQDARNRRRRLRTKLRRQTKRAVAARKAQLWTATIIAVFALPFVADIIGLPKALLILASGYVAFVAATVWSIQTVASYSKDL